jgi:hypothetical protein
MTNNFRSGIDSAHRPLIGRSAFVAPRLGGQFRDAGLGRNTPIVANSSDLLVALVNGEVRDSARALTPRLLRERDVGPGRRLESRLDRQRTLDKPGVPERLSTAKPAKGRPPKWCIKARHIAGNGRAPVQGFRRQRRKLAFSASALRPSASPYRPDEAEKVGTGLTSRDRATIPRKWPPLNPCYSATCEFERSSRNRVRKCPFSSPLVSDP